MSVLIEFLGEPPALVSAGHDGLYPYANRPYDEIFVIAYYWGSKAEEQEVRFWLPNNTWLTIGNVAGLSRQVRVHSSGFLWHDRVREIDVPKDAKWLTKFGFTSVDPKNLKQDHSELFAVLPGSPMGDSLEDLMASKKWRSIRDFHTRHRDWMPTNITKFNEYEALRFERDRSLVENLKGKRGATCQICGFTFKKADGTEYCEVHHLEALANGGLDVAANCLVLCANCHKQFHYGDVEILDHTSSRLIVKIDGRQYSCEVG